MARYTLMNKNKQVLDFSYNLDFHAVTKILEIHDLRYAPPAILDPKGKVTRRNLNDWWQRRAIPASRNHIEELLANLRLTSTIQLAEKNFGLSLSDRYWFNDPSDPQRWEDINFFDNEFSDELGVMTLGQSLSQNPNLMSPNSTLGGDLNKKWKCIDGKRVLLKAGTGLAQQEVLNEVIATKLFSRILSDDEYVPYQMLHINGQIYSACENMLHDDEELVTAYDIIKTRRKANDINDYQFLVNCYKELGLPDVELTLEKMFTCDYILANADRHYQNFGVIRNVETLEYTRVAPIFDNGTSLWCRQFQLDYHTEYIAKPFGQNGMKPDRQLELFHDFSWLDMSKLEGFTNEIREVLGQNPNIPMERVNLICAKVDKKIEKVVKKQHDAELEQTPQRSVEEDIARRKEEAHHRNSEVEPVDHDSKIR